MMKTTPAKRRASVEDARDVEEARITNVGGMVVIWDSSSWVSLSRRASVEDVEDEEACRCCNVGGAEVIYDTPTWAGVRD